MCLAASAFDTIHEKALNTPQEAAGRPYIKINAQLLEVGRIHIRPASLPTAKNCVGVNTLACIKRTPYLLGKQFNTN